MANKRDLFFLIYTLPTDHGHRTSHAIIKIKLPRWCRVHTLHETILRNFSYYYFPLFLAKTTSLCSIYAEQRRRHQLFAACSLRSRALLCSALAKERDYMEIIFTRTIARRGHTMLNYRHNLHFWTTTTWSREAKRCWQRLAIGADTTHMPKCISLCRLSANFIWRFGKYSRECFCVVDALLYTMRLDVGTFWSSALSLLMHILPLKNSPHSKRTHFGLWWQSYFLCKHGPVNKNLCSYGKNTKNISFCTYMLL